jgi:hypothetical protein
VSIRLSSPTSAPPRACTWLAAALLLASAIRPARGQPAAPPVAEKIAVLRLEALGMDAEPVARLESLFRMEIERLVGRPLPTRRQIEAAIKGSRKLRACGGDNACLAQIGALLGVDLVITGSVAALGDSYVIHIKVVDVATGKPRGEPIASEPLRGQPDQLIEAVRVAAYTLLAPDEVRGSIAVLSDLVGATVALDGAPVGTTPLAAPIAGLRPGRYRLGVTADGYLPFEQEVDVRFQKTTRAVVRLAPRATVAPVPTSTVIRPRPAPRHWYTSTWFTVGAGVAAAVVGGYVGYRLARDPVIDCGADPGACGR